MFVLGNNITQQHCVSDFSFPKTWKENCSPNKHEIFESFQKAAGSVFRRREEGAVNVVIRNRPFFHSLKQWRCYKACRSDLFVRRTIWGHVNLADKFRKVGSASAGKLQTCSSQDVSSGVWLCPVNRVAFRIGPGCVFGGQEVGEEWVWWSRKTSLRRVLQVVMEFLRRCHSVVPMSAWGGCVLGLISAVTFHPPPPAEYYS